MKLPRAKYEFSVRVTVILLGLALVLSSLAPLMARVFAAAPKAERKATAKTAPEQPSKAPDANDSANSGESDASPVQVHLASANAIPRKLEDSTQNSIRKGYAKAWQSMEVALAEDRMDTIEQNFVGVARDALVKRVTEQMKSGVRTKYIDHGHNLDAIFFSPEGTAMQLRDTAQLEIQYFDGDNIIHSETITQQYHVLMSVAEDRWKVRVLQGVPGRKPEANSKK